MRSAKRQNCKAAKRQNGKRQKQGRTTFGKLLAIHSANSLCFFSKPSSKAGIVVYSYTGLYGHAGLDAKLTDEWNSGILGPLLAMLLASD